MLFKKIINVYSENRKKATDKFYEQYKGIFLLKQLCSIYNYVLNGERLFSIAQTVMIIQE
jgi:hypothetical protein